MVWICALILYSRVAPKAIVLLPILLAYLNPNRMSTYYPIISTQLRQSPLTNTPVALGTKTSVADVPRLLMSYP